MADEERTFDGALLPVFFIVVESVDLGGRRDGEDGVDGGLVTLKNGEVEFGVCPRGHGLDVEGLGFVVGDLDLVERVGLGAVGLMLSLTGFSWCHFGYEKGSR